MVNRSLTLHVDGTRISQLAGDDGCGVRALALSRETFIALCAEYTAFLRPLGREPISIRVLVDHQSATVALLADGFAYEAAGSLD